MSNSSVQHQLSIQKSPNTCDGTLFYKIQKMLPQIYLADPSSQNPCNHVSNATNDHQTYHTSKPVSLIQVTDYLGTALHVQ